MAPSVLVIALGHPMDRPEMDWWSGRADPPGNRVLADIVRRLCDWVPHAYGMQTFHLPYHVEKGGIFLKDAAVAAGLGCIGRNNLLVTREYGPRVRLRALTLDGDLVSTGPLLPRAPLGFDPCEGCDAPCLRSCPQGAFDTQVHDPVEVGLEHLPGRSGYFSRARCNLQMEADIERAVGVVKYCRACELSCPVGLATRL